MHKVKLIGSNQVSVEFCCTGRQSVLDAFRVQGILNPGKSKEIRIPYACKTGGCGLCKIEVLSGEYSLGTCSETVLPFTEQQRNYSLACRTVPGSDMIIRVCQKQIPDTGTKTLRHSQANFTMEL